VGGGTTDRWARRAGGRACATCSRASTRGRQRAGRARALELGRTGGPRGHRNRPRGALGRRGVA
jgi:hypothetical protein